jgi:hypothetical protein
MVSLWCFILGWDYCIDATPGHTNRFPSITPTHFYVWVHPWHDRRRDAQTVISLELCMGAMVNTSPNSRFFGGVPTPLMWFSWVWFVFLMRDIIAPLIEQLWDGAYFLKMFSWLVHGCLRDLYVYSFNGHYTPQLTVSPTVPPLKWSMSSGFTTHHFFSSNLPAVFIWGSLFGRHARGYLVFGWRSLDLLYR